MAKEKYFLVTGIGIDILAFKDQHELVDAIRKLHKEEQVASAGLQVFMGEGDRVHISKGAYKYIMFPDGKKIPIFEPEEKVEIDKEGYLVDPPDFDQSTLALPNKAYEEDDDLSEDEDIE